MRDNEEAATIRKYYNSLESRIGYRLFLGGTRHFGYYASETSPPWPIGPALREMEKKLLTALNCKEGARILDAGCGAGHVALYMAREGRLNVEAIDLTPHHVAKARANVHRANMSSQISVSPGDYHYLDAFENASFDGIYTMETLVHSSNPQHVLQQFLRLLKPGGRLVMHEYDHIQVDKAPREMADKARAINKIVGMPAFDAWELDDLPRAARRAGFEHVDVMDMSANIVPMLWLFYVFAYIPYAILKLFGLQYRFINNTSAVEMYRGREYWRYLQISAQKPL